jgi:hypothetical protein
VRKDTGSRNNSQVISRVIIPLTAIAREERADSKSALLVLIDISRRVLERVRERVSARDNGLITADAEQSTITEERASRAEGVRDYVHGPDLICGEVVLGSPGRVAIDLKDIVLYFVEKVDLGASAQEELLGRDSRVANLLETADFVIRSYVGGLTWILRVLAPRESRLEGTISGCSGLDEMVDLARLKGGIPQLLSSCSSCREDEGRN